MSKILVIEDEDAMRENILELLTEEGYDAIGASDGEKGVFQVWKEMPDLIICDIMMPKLDGHGVLSKISQDVRLTSIPFLFLTAKVSHEDIRRGMNLGADDYITKPFTRSELLHAISIRLNKWQRIETIAQKKLIDLQKNLSTNFPHELLTPLSVTLSYSELLHENADRFSSEDVRAISRDIHNSAKKLLKLVENYLLYFELIALDADTQKGDVYRKAASTADEVFIRAIVEDKVREQNRQADLSLELEPARLTIYEPHLERMIAEIVENSIKFSHAGSPIGVVGRILQDNQRYRLSVQDRGRGMSADQIRALDGFAPFEWQLRETHGTGLMLAKRLVLFYGGTMRIISQPLQGTLIEMDLRLSAD